MKRKTIVSISSLLLGATLLTGCTGTSYKVVFGDYWYYHVEQPTQGQTLEKLTYKVGFKSDAGWNNYSVNYTDGVYVTTLSTDTEKYGKEVYKYDTSLTIKVAYTYDGKTSDTFTDTVTSTVYFEKAAKALAPLYSEKHVVSHSPQNGDISDATQQIPEYNYSVVVDYATKKRTVTNHKATDESYKSKTIDVEIEEKDLEKYSLIDNEALLLALRAINPSSAVSHELLVYAPFSEEAQKITASFAKKEIAENITFKQKDGTEFKGNISYNPVTLSINSSNSGAAQTVWVANADDVKANKFRNVILRYEAPVSYNLGTLIYTLDTAEFTEKA